MNAKWSVLVVYENKAAQETAVQFCDAMIQRFWPDFTIDVNWASRGELENPRASKETEHAAVEAQLIVVASSQNRGLSESLSSWLELALRKRADREGVLVGLPQPQGFVNQEAAASQVFLRKLAHQNGMDYLTTVPEYLPVPESESAESYTSRASQMTSVLDKILHHSPIPPRMI